MSQNRKTLEQVKGQVKDHLPMYLAAMGVNASGPTFHCINPDHPDKNPSCGLVKAAHDRIFHCFSCHTVGDIFVAAHFLEGKPLAGAGFITDNLIPLAIRFGVEVPDLPPPSEEDVFLDDTYRSYLHAAMIVRSSPLSERVRNRVTDLGWDKTLMSKLGVGGVVSFEDYIGRMTGTYGHKREFLEKVGLAKKQMFNENNLIFTVKTEDGAPAGFACRNLRYEEEKAKYQQKVAEINTAHGTGSDAAKEAISQLFRTAKYVNTGSECPIYNKGQLLFLFNEARKFAPPLWVFEGYPDGVTAHHGGMLSASAIGATAFTEAHLEMLLRLKIKHLIFVLDADDAGQDAMQRIVKMLETMGGHPGLTVELVSMPEGTDDPDNFIRKHGDFKKGVQALRQLPRMDMFAWSLREKMRRGEEPTYIAESTIPMIVNEVNNIKRLTMIKKLAQQTGLDEAFLTREVQRQVDIDVASLDAERVQLAKKCASEISKNPAGLETILESFRGQAEALQRRKTGYSPAHVLEAIHLARERAEKNTRDTELNTRFPMLNRVMNGIPRAEAFITWPGAPNQGKSTFFYNLCWDIPELNEDSMVFLHSVDDALSACLPRIYGAKFNLPSAYFARPNFFRNQVPDFDQIYAEATAWMDHLLETERLVIADASVLPAQLPAFEMWVRTLRNKYPNRDLVCMGDNFHLYDLPGFDPGEGRIREMSKFIKRLANVYHTTQLFTMELPKTAFRFGMRPRMANIKGSSGMAYDANANFGVYNDMKSREAKANIYWDGPPEIVLGPNGECGSAPRRMPILELVIDKSKLSSFDGTIYYRLDPDTGHLEECNDMEQAKYRGMANEYHHSQAEQSQAPYQNF